MKSLTPPNEEIDILKEETKSETETETEIDRDEPISHQKNALPANKRTCLKSGANQLGLPRFLATLPR